MWTDANLFEKRREFERRYRKMFPMDEGQEELFAASMKKITEEDAGRLLVLIDAIVAATPSAAAATISLEQDGWLKFIKRQQS